MREDEDPADIAWKLIAVNLSDLAAKGAQPVGVLVSHMLGDDDDRFAQGLGEILEAYDVPLLGGDTVRADGRRVWGCTAIGKASSITVPDRRGAQAGGMTAGPPRGPVRRFPFSPLQVTFRHFYEGYQRGRQPS